MQHFEHKKDITVSRLKTVVFSFSLVTFASFNFCSCNQETSSQDAFRKIIEGRSETISDVVALVMKPTMSDLEGTKLVSEAMVKGYATDKAVGIIFNRALDKSWQPHQCLPCADDDYQRIVADAKAFTESNGIEVFAWVDCMCDISRSQADRIFVLSYPDHPYSKSIEECSQNIIAAYNKLE